MVCSARDLVCAKCTNRATEAIRKEMKRLRRRRDGLYERLTAGVQAQVCTCIFLLKSLSFSSGCSCGIWNLPYICVISMGCCWGDVCAC